MAYYTLEEAVEKITKAANEESSDEESSDKDSSDFEPVKSCRILVRDQLGVPRKMKRTLRNLEHTKVSGRQKNGQVWSSSHAETFRFVQ